MAGKGAIRPGLGERLFDGFNAALLVLLGLITLYPFWDAFIVSFSTLEGYLGSTMHLWPAPLSLHAYSYIVKLPELWSSYGNTLVVTVGGTLISLASTAMAAYALAQMNLPGRRALMFLVVVTMMFSGGMIPMYIVVRTLGIMNTLWALILPGAISTYNLIILRNFFMALPPSLSESALMDGCTEMGVLFRIVLPISKAGLMTIALFYAVGYWNEFFAAVMYITRRARWPLQLFLRSMLFESEATYMSGSDSLFLLGQPMKMAAVMMAVIPITLAYPFFQKHFVKGVMIGAVKG